MPEITIEKLTKSFGRSTVLDGVSLSVRDGEFVTLLGPSGCGKTTTLMAIAGLQSPDSGRIACGGEVFADPAAGIDLPAERRDVGVVFQSYAVWPHMTVAQNVAFPLRLRRTGSSETRRRVAEVLELVELGAHARRYPHELSGGQQQRVALARAIAYRPRVLLLDEPFSNLDAKLRERARERLRNVHESLGLTTVFVTHDQDEALSMSDRILVMNAGRILRAGSPQEVYAEPGARFVAEFVGECTFLTGTLVPDGAGGNLLRTPEFPAGFLVRGRGVPGPATVAVRPEEIEVHELDDDRLGPPGTVLESSYHGDHYRHRIAVGAQHLTVRTRRPVRPGPLRVAIPPGAASIVTD